VKIDNNLNLDPSPSQLCSIPYPPHHYLDRDLGRDLGTTDHHRDFGVPWLSVDDETDVSAAAFQKDGEDCTYLGWDMRAR
jgi:hypothetical protein